MKRVVSVIGNSPGCCACEAEVSRAIKTESRVAEVTGRIIVKFRQLNVHFGSRYDSGVTEVDAAIGSCCAGSSLGNPKWPDGSWQRSGLRREASQKKHCSGNPANMCLRLSLLQRKGAQWHPTTVWRCRMPGCQMTETSSDDVCSALGADVSGQLLRRILAQVHEELIAAGIGCADDVKAEEFHGGEVRQQ